MQDHLNILLLGTEKKYVSPPLPLIEMDCSNQWILFQLTTYWQQASLVDARQTVLFVIFPYPCICHQLPEVT